MISESRHDSQVELRVCRLVGAAAAASADMGRPLMVHHPGAPAASFSSAAEAARFVSSASRLAAAAGAAGASAAAAAAAAGHRPSVTISDPLGDTLMLNPHSANSTQGGTRIQVGQPSILRHFPYFPHRRYRQYFPNRLPTPTNHVFEYARKGFPAFRKGPRKK